MYIRMVVHNRMTLHKIFELLLFTYSVRIYTILTNEHDNKSKNQNNETVHIC